MSDRIREILGWNRDERTGVVSPAVRRAAVCIPISSMEGIPSMARHANCSHPCAC